MQDSDWPKIQMHMKYLNCRAGLKAVLATTLKARYKKHSPQHQTHICESYWGSSVITIVLVSSQRGFRFYSHTV